MPSTRASLHGEMGGAGPMNNAQEGTRVHSREWWMEWKWHLQRRRSQWTSAGDAK